MFFFDEAAPTIAQTISLEQLWIFLPVGYLTTILIEISILVFGLSPKLSLKEKLLCGVWLTACTYPIVVLVLPAIFLDSSRTAYLIVAETFAPLGEIFFFWLAFRGKGRLENNDFVRCFAAIVIANLASFGIGEIFNHYRWFGIFG